MLQILKESKLFNECSSQELHNIANICQRVIFKNGERIFEAKSPAAYLCIVSEGVRELRFTVDYYQAPEEITFEQKARGEVFGWSALARPYVYTLSALAVQNSDLLRLDEKDIKQLCANNHHLGYIFMKNLTEIIGERFHIVQRMLINEIQQNLNEKEA